MPAPAAAENTFNIKKVSLYQLIEQLRKHPIFSSLNSADKVQLFMSLHVYSVWGYISLLRRLQLIMRSGLASWAPTAYPGLMRIINDLILSEETELCDDGAVRSHYEMYVIGLDELATAMQSRGLLLDDIDENTGFSAFNRYTRFGLPAHDAAAKARIQPCAVEYIKSVTEVQQTSIIDELLANLVFGYSDPVHSVLLSSIRALGINLDEELPVLNEYLKIHSGNVTDENKKLDDLLKLVLESTGQSLGVQNQIYDYAIKAVKVRIAFWDGALQLINKS